MLEKEYVFYGKHADLVKQLTTVYVSQFKEETKFIERNVDVLEISAVIGIINNKRSKVERRKGKDGSEVTTKIFVDTMIKERETIKFIYENVMLLHNKNTESIEKRIERAFRYYNQSDEYKKECFDIFNSYVLGGLEILHENIIGSSKNSKDIIENIMDYINTFYNIYSSDNDKRDLKDVLKQFQ